MSVVTVTRGSIIICRVYDVAEELDLNRIESEAREPGGPSRLRLARSTGHALILRDAPLTLALGETTIHLAGVGYRAELMARVWSYGVASLQFHLPIPPGTSWEGLVQLAARAEYDNDVDAVARTQVRELADRLASAATLPHDPQGDEDYVVFFLESIDGVKDVRDLPQRVDIPALILGEPQVVLAPDVRQPILESALSYSTSDLAVIDWNSALVVDPTGSRDVVDMVEFAVSHLMELRYYDTLLDDRLATLFDAIERKRRIPGFFRGEYARLSQEANSLYLEFSEHMERIENSLKFVGDFFLATVYRRATTRFHSREWEDNVMRKLNALARVSELLGAEVNVRRSHVLELIIIVLILLEIVQATVLAVR